MGDFISEFKMLVRIGSHPNIVNLVGAAVNVDEGEGRVDRYMWL